MKLFATLLGSLASLAGLVAAGEGIHLVDCDAALYSEILYYANDADASNGQIPASSNICQWTYEVTWGNYQYCTFSTGVTVYTGLYSNPASYSAYSYVGTVSNGAHTFSCFRDDDHAIYTTGSGFACRSKFYCIDPY